MTIRPGISAAVVHEAESGRGADPYRYLAQSHLLHPKRRGLPVRVVFSEIREPPPTVRRWFCLPYTLVGLR